MPALRYATKQGKQFDFYVDGFNQIYCVIKDLSRWTVENPEGVIRINNIVEFFGEAEIIENIAELLKSDSRWGRFVKSKMDELLN